jgi:hypothetical protein
MRENDYFIGLTSITEFLKTHDATAPLYYSIGRQEIGGFHGIIREKWTLCLSDIQSGTCRYYLQTVGYTDKINGEPFNREIFDNCRERAQDLREQIKNSLGEKFDLFYGGVSFPKDLVLHEGNDIEYDPNANRFLFEKILEREPKKKRINPKKFAA